MAFLLSGCDDDGPATITFTSVPGPLAFAAVQVADGPWQVITPSNGKYSFPAVGPTYGIVAVCGESNNANVTVLQATVAETTTPAFECADRRLVAALGGTVTGTSDQLEWVHVADQYLGQPGDKTYSFGAPAGTWDVFARLNSTPYEIARIIRRNAVNLAPAPPTTVVDFDFATEGFAPETRSITFDGDVAGDQSVVVTSVLHTKPGGTSFYVTSMLADASQASYQALPASELRGDDIQNLTVTVPVDGYSNHAVRRWFRAPEDFTIALPAMPPPSEFYAEATTPYMLMRGSIPSGVDVDLYEFVYSQTRTERRMSWTARLSRGYRDTVNPTTYTLPDLSALAGFDIGWGLTWEERVGSLATTTTTTGDAADLLTTDRGAATLDGHLESITTQGGPN